MSKYVYVAGPYTGNEEENVATALRAATVLLGAGLYPYVPHLSHYWEAQYAHHYEVWMELDFGWVRRCDAVLRLPGASKGADREVELARSLGLPVFALVSEVIAWSKTPAREAATAGGECHRPGPATVEPPYKRPQGTGVTRPRGGPVTPVSYVVGSAPLPYLAPRPVCWNHGDHADRCSADKHFNRWPPPFSAPATAGGECHHPAWACYPDGRRECLKCGAPGGACPGPRVQP